MADSYRLTVLKRLTTLLEGTTLTPVVGLDPALPATLSGVVFRGRSVFGESDPRTMIALLESPRSQGTIYGGTDNEARLESWGVLLQGFCPELKTHPSDSIYSVLDDVERRLSRITATLTSNGKAKYPTDYMLGAALDGNGRLITEFQMTPGTVRPPTENISNRTFFYIPLQIGLARISAE